MFILEYLVVISCLKSTGQFSLESGFVVAATRLIFKNFQCTRQNDKDEDGVLK